MLPPPLLLHPSSPPFGSIHSRIIGVLAAVEVRIYSQDSPSHSHMQPDLQVNSSAAASPFPPHTLGRLPAGVETMRFTSERAKLDLGF